MSIRACLSECHCVHGYSLLTGCRVCAVTWFLPSTWNVSFCQCFSHISLYWLELSTWYSVWPHVKSDSLKQSIIFHISVWAVCAYAWLWAMSICTYRRTSIYINYIRIIYHVCARLVHVSLSVHTLIYSNFSPPQKKRKSNKSQSGKFKRQLSNLIGAK